MDLSGKKIMVVGSISGIAKAIIRRLYVLGASLILIDRCDQTQERLYSEWNNTKCYVCDFSELDKIKSMMRSIIDKEGKIDGFVFTITHSDFRPLPFVDVENLNEIMCNNFNLFVELVRSIFKAKGLKDGCSIVTMSSISSIRAMKAKMAFCAAKAATDAAVRCLALELGQKGIRVNSIQKGGVDVDMEKEHIQNIASINNNAVKEKQILGLVKADEIGNTVAFLLSEAARSITGISLVVDGGYMLC